MVAAAAAAFTSGPANALPALSFALYPSPTAPDGVSDGECSLREAIAVANGSGTNECDTARQDFIVAPHPQIHLSAGTYTLDHSGAEDNTNANGDLDVLHDVSILGAGADQTTIAVAPTLHDRAIDVQPNFSLDITGVTITGGHAPDGADGTDGGDGENGGGLRLTGTGSLGLYSVAFTNNQAGNAGNATTGFPGYGGRGGAVSDDGSGSGTLTIANSTFSGNRSGAGGNTQAASNAGSSGNGGAVSAYVPVTISGSTFTNNATATGGIGISGPSPSSGGSSGRGGAVMAPSLTVTGSTFTNNWTADGTASGDDTDGANGTIAGAGGNGGALATDPGSISVTDSVLSGNHTGSGGNGGSGNGGSSGYSGNGGGGGAIDSYASLTLTRSTLVGNWTGNGGTTASGVASNGGPGGGAVAEGPTITIDSSTLSGNTTGNGGGSQQPGHGGDGGGLGSYAATALLITDSTIAGNSTGIGGNGANGARGGRGGVGAGVFTSSTQGTIVNSTIASNTTGAGGSGTSAGDRSLAGGIALTNGSAATLENSVVAGNAPKQCGGDTLPDDGGYNVSFPDGFCPGVIADPKLSALAENGGPTKTMALGEGSSGVDIVPTSGANCPATDQRGVVRPQRTACDAGAFELEPLPPAPAADQGGGGSGGQTGTQPTPTPTSTAADTTPPAIKLLLTRQKLRTVLKKGYFAFFSDNEVGSASAQFDATGKDARGTAVRRPKRVAFGTVRVTKAGKQKLVLKFTKRVARAIAKRKKITLTLALVAKDAAGNSTNRSAKVILRR